VSAVLSVASREAISQCIAPSPLRGGLGRGTIAVMHRDQKRCDFARELRSPPQETEPPPVASREAISQCFAPSPLRGGLGRGRLPGCTAIKNSVTSRASCATGRRRQQRRLWHFLRAEKLGVKFRRQAAIGAYVVDFVCFPRKLIIELDGPQHLEVAAQQHDGRRTASLAAQGFRVVRFRNQELDEDIRSVVKRIEKALAEN
jgi:very-short-patch-repair endonuclease